ncbi:HAD-IC family P-type ATPase, partial [Candidatus Micrarchaeota archaeon]|nr:HAD-IC family P-type ATPase [Candidatus Micrarchaeota archaeon]
MADFHALSAREALKELRSSERGLSEEEARARLAQYGANALREKKRQSALMLFLGEFTDLLIVILIIAAVISGFLGEWLDAYAILAVVVLNGIIGFAQEYKAEKALEALKKMIAPKARVVRAGVELRVDARDLVPGDVLVLEEGDKVTADCRLFEVVSLEADEAALTGESMPTKKNALIAVGEKQPVNEQANMLFLGTIVTRGRGKAVVVATGMSTELGKIAEMVSGSQDEETPLQKKLAALGKQLGIGALVIVALVFFAGLLRGFEALEIFMISVSLAVAAIPEGLPAVVTISLAIGVQRMAKKNAIIRKLPAVETLGAATVICTDKTGTLTKNELTVRKLFVDDQFVSVTGEGYGLHGDFVEAGGSGKKISPLKNKELFELLQSSVLCNNSNLVFDAGGSKASIVGDPTEACLLVLAEKAGLDYKELREEYAFVSEIPFDSTRKMMTVTRIVAGGKRKAFVKGAPEMLLENSVRILKNGVEEKLSEAEKKKILEANRLMASNALRVLGFAYRILGEKESPESGEVEKNLVFVGLAGMMDPPRPEVRQAVNACKTAGIRVVMITGDNPDTARAVARELGLLGQDGSRIVTGAELNDFTEAQLRELVKDVVVYARVSPEHKLRIVDALKARGEIVAMTGDGVNDAPAIKKADIGIAMGITGTDVAKEASDMVVVDDNFASIEHAVEEGRVIYDNILKAVRFLVSCNIGELLAIFFAIIGGLKSPLTPIQILWMNIVTDSPPALALAMEPKDPDVMRRPPRSTSEKILTRESFSGMFLVGLLVALGTL